MSGPYVEFAGEMDTGRGPSAALWNSAGSVLADLAVFNVGRGFIAWRDDFIDLMTGRYTFTDITPVGSAATMALLDAENGVVRIATVSTTAGEGGQFQNGTTTGECVVASAGNVIWFEAQVKATTITTNGPDFFLGLCVADTTILTPGTPAALTAQSIGFTSLTKDRILLAGCKDGTALTTGTGATIVDGTYVKLGFKVYGTTKVEFFVNGVLVSTITANIPTTEMKASAYFATGGTDASTLDIDWGHCVVQQSGT